MAYKANDKATDSVDDLLERAEYIIAAKRLEDRRRRKDGNAAGVLANMNADGVVEGYASTWDRIPDSYGDVVRFGAFADTLREWRQRNQPIPLLYGHRTDDPKYNIGRVIEAYEDDRGLFVRAEFDADNETAQEVRKLAQQGRLFQFSFAYSVVEQAKVTLSDGTRANELRRVDLYEVSLVQVPANQHATVTSVKGGIRVGADGDNQKLVEAMRMIYELYEAESAKAEAYKTLLDAYKVLLGGSE